MFIRQFFLQDSLWSLGNPPAIGLDNNQWRFSNLLSISPSRSTWVYPSLGSWRRRKMSWLYLWLSVGLLGAVLTKWDSAKQKTSGEPLRWPEMKWIIILRRTLSAFRQHLDDSSTEMIAPHFSHQFQSNQIDPFNRSTHTMLRKSCLICSTEAFRAFSCWNNNKWILAILIGSYVWQLG